MSARDTKQRRASSVAVCPLARAVAVSSPLVHPSRKPTGAQPMSRWLLKPGQRPVFSDPTGTKDRHVLGKNTLRSSLQCNLKILF